MPLPAVTSTDPSYVRQAIADAARRTGTDFDYLYNQARIESSLDPSAKARTSSASGLFQFTRQTWLQTLKAHGSNHGLQWAADAIQASGRGLAVADPELRQAIQDLRFDPAVASSMAAEFAADNGERLEGALGRAPEPVDLYLAHFLGAGGATRFLTAHDSDPSQPAAPLLPEAAAANRSIFYTTDGRARSVGEIRASFAAKLGAQTPSATEPPRWFASRSDTNSCVSTPLQMASFDPMPRTLSLDFAARAYARLSGGRA